MSWADFHDSVSEIFGQGADQIIEGRKPKPGTSGQSAIVKPNLGDRLWGRSQQELTEAYRTNESDKLSTKYRARIEALGGKWIPNQSPGYYESELTRLNDKRKDDRFPKTPEGRAWQSSEDQRKDDNKRSDNQFAITNKRLDAQLALSTKQTEFQNNALIAQMQDNQRNRSFDREQSSADRALTLQLANINADLQDKRLAYDKETRRLDRRDRNIAQLMSGLGQLGGAFSL